MEILKLMENSKFLVLNFFFCMIELSVGVMILVGNWVCYFYLVFIIVKFLDVVGFGKGERYGFMIWNGIYFMWIVFWVLFCVIEWLFVMIRVWYGCLGGYWISCLF